MSITNHNYYHLYNRGCDRDLIFFKESHYFLLLRLIKKNHQKFKIRIIAYCLMPNHYHLLIGSPVIQSSEGLSGKNHPNQTDVSPKLSEGLKNPEPVSQFIRNTFNSYVQTVNPDMQRKGTLFESKCKSIWIDKEIYLLQLIRYIHLNPVLACLCSQPEDWTYSNCREWLGLRKGTLFSNNFFNTYFTNFEQYRDFLQSYKEDKLFQAKMKKYGFGL